MVGLIDFPVLRDRRSNRDRTDRSWSAESCTVVMFIIGIFALVVVFCNIYHSSPSVELKRFYVPGLDKSLNSSKNSSIAFKIYFSNRGVFVSSSVYFDPINVTFYDGPSENHSVANYTIPEFYIRAYSKYSNDGWAEYSGMVNATGLDLDVAKKEIAANGFRVFRMDLITSVRYDFYMFWYTRRDEYRKTVDVKVGDTGAAAKFGISFAGVTGLVMINLMVVVFLCA